MRTNKSFEISFLDEFAGREQNLLIHLAISRDFRPILADRTFKGSFAENRDHMALYEEHGTKRWKPITSCTLPEVTTVFLGLVFHELYENKNPEKNIGQISDWFPR